MTNKEENVVTKRKFSWTNDGPFEFLRIVASVLVALVITFIVLCFVAPEPVDTFIKQFEKLKIKLED